MKYFGGRPMPENVVNALRLAAKTGFLSRRLWYELFATGGERWNRRQIEFMLKRGLLMPHPNPAAEDHWVLTPLGRSLVENTNLATVRASPVAQLHHDEVIARSLVRLERQGIVTQWLTEQELKRMQVKEFQLSNDVRNQKYPDAVFKSHVLGRERTFAIEYERTRKSPVRYKDILWLYSRSDTMSLVLFICENKTIENTILGRMKYLRVASLWNTIGLTQASDWTFDPATAPIRLNHRVVTLKDLCQKTQALAG